MYQKSTQYSELLSQIESLLESETDLTANLANVAAIIKQQMDFFWVGFYLVKPSEKGMQLVLGPFQGPLACTRINYNKGVCGTSWAKQQTLIVPDVEEFPGHIACSSRSKSEIVIPIFAPCAQTSPQTVLAVLDIDSEQLNSFDSTDAHYLEQICALLSKIF